MPSQVNRFTCAATMPHKPILTVGCYKNCHRVPIPRIVENPLKDSISLPYPGCLTPVTRQQEPLSPCALNPGLVGLHKSSQNRSKRVLKNGFRRRLTLSSWGSKLGPVSGRIAHHSCQRPMPKEPTTYHPTMEGKGAYNRNARLPAGGGALALPLLEKAARNVALGSEEQLATCMGRSEFFPCEDP